MNNNVKIAAYDRLHDEDRDLATTKAKLSTKMKLRTKNNHSAHDAATEGKKPTDYTESDWTLLKLHALNIIRSYVGGDVAHTTNHIEEPEELYNALHEYYVRFIS